jgi:hypothetical protein
MTKWSRTQATAYDPGHKTGIFPAGANWPHIPGRGLDAFRQVRESKCGKIHRAACVSRRGCAQYTSRKFGDNVLALIALQARPEGWRLQFQHDEVNREF